MELKLETFLHWNHPPGDYVKPQSHHFYEIIYYEKGSGKTTIDGEVYNFKDDCIAVITPDTIHDEESYEPTTVLFCLFSYDQTAEEPQLVNGLIKNNNANVGDVLALLYKIKEEMQNKRQNFEQYLDFLMGQILILIQRIQHGNHTGNASDGIEFVKNFLKENYSNSIYFDLLAEQIGYSYDRFRHLFKESTGMSPSQYLINIRIAKAKEILENSTSPIRTISRFCGFNNVTKFIEMFKTKTGFTPLKYRKLMQVTGTVVLNFEELEKEDGNNPTHITKRRKVNRP
jgi:AraC family transcriptional activator of pobA